jgi:hypothetical protein
VIADPGFRDYFGVVDAGINAHFAIVGGIAARGALLDAMLGAYEARAVAAMKAARNALEDFHRKRK